MYESTMDQSEGNSLRWAMLGAICLAALAVSIVFSPAAGLYDLHPAAKQIAASQR